MRRKSCVIALALVVATAGSAQDAKPFDPLIARISPTDFVADGDCYLRAFNAQNGARLTAQGIKTALTTLPKDHPARNALKFDDLLLGAEIALDAPCTPTPTPTVTPPDRRLVNIWNGNSNICEMLEIYSLDEIASLRSILSSTSDASLAQADIQRAILDQFLNNFALVDCSGDTTPPKEPKTDDSPKPTPKAVLDWRALRAAPPMTRFNNFDIPLDELLIDDRYIALLSNDLRDPSVASVADSLGISTAAVIEVMPRLGAALLALPATDLARVASNPIVTGLTQDRLGFFNNSSPANSPAQDLVDQLATALNDEFDPLDENRKVRVYVVDGGIRADHEEVAAKIQHWRAIGRYHGGLTRRGCENHGTAVASIIAGKTIGIAQNVDLVDVDITPCDGRDFESFPASHILIALDWISQTQQFLPDGEIPTVVNLSLGVPAGDSSAFVREGIPPFGQSLFGLDAFEEKVEQFLTRNPSVTIVAAAGNEGRNACHYFPARMENVITVGGTKLDSTLAPFSNFGPCVDTFALGETVPIAHASGGQTAMTTIEGTSFSTAIVTGVIAHRLAAGQDIQNIRQDMLRPVTAPRTIQANLDRGNLPEDGQLGARLNALAKIPSPFRPDCTVNSYDGTLNMRSGPSTRNRVLRRLSNGEGLLFLERAGDKWLRVTLEDGQEGWVASYDKRAVLVQNVQGRNSCVN